MVHSLLSVRVKKVNILEVMCVNDEMKRMILFVKTVIILIFHFQRSLAM